MYKYYAFLVKKEIKKIYVDSEKELYMLLKRLKNTDNMNLGISIYYQMFDVINTSYIKTYLNNKINIKKNNNKYLFDIEKSREKTLIEINPSCIVIFTNVEFPTIFKSLKYLYYEIFICDFNTNKYLFLN